MKTTKTSLLLLMGLFLAFGCSSDDDAPVDPRAAFVGEYETKDYELSYSFVNTNNSQSDTTIVANGGVDIEIDFVEDDKEEIRIEGLNEFLEEAFHDLAFATGATGSASVAKTEVTAEVTGGEFELEEADFILTVIANNATASITLTLSGQGSLNENMLMLEFEYSGSNTNGTVTFSGEVKMEKQ